MLTVFLYALLILLGCASILIFVKCAVDWIPRKVHRLLVALYGFLTVLFLLRVFVMCGMVSNGYLDAKTFKDNIYLIVGLTGAFSLLGCFHYHGWLFSKKE